MKKYLHRIFLCGSLVLLGSFSTAHASDDTPPTISSFQAVASSTRALVNFSASDAGGLLRAELWRAPLSPSGCVVGNMSNCSWSEALRQDAPEGLTEWVGQLVDTPAAGTYWYGIHIVDRAHNYSHEDTPTRLSLPLPRTTFVEPRLPLVYLNWEYPTLAAEHVVREVKVACGGAPLCYSTLQAAIDAANYGDEIIVDADVVTGPVTLRNKGVGEAWILIRAALLSEIGTGRVGPTQAALLPDIISPGSNQPALTTEAGAHHYWIAGMEFRKATPTAVVSEMVQLGIYGAAQNSLALVPHDLVLDRAYIHGDPTSDLKRGISLNSARTVITESYIADVHLKGVESQALAILNGPGPFRITNNYLEGATQGVLSGGADPFISNLVPADIEFRHNHVFKPLAWRGVWTVKNLFELKNAERVLIEGNVFENVWKDGQVGAAILFTPRNQDNGCPWCVVRDVTFRNNIIRHAGEGFQILGRDNVHPSQLTERIRISNNVLEDINTFWGGPGWAFLIDGGSSAAGPRDVTIDHNTGFHNGGALILAASYFSGSNTYSPKPDFTFINNIFAHNDYGIKGDNTGVGNDAILKFFPNSYITKNVLMGGNPSAYNKSPGNFFPANWGLVGFTDQALGDYHLVNSPYQGQATDGTDVGVNFTQFEAAF